MTDPKKKENGPKPKVLVVDDDAALAETIADALSERAYDAVPVASSREAKRLLLEEQVDALVTDLRMPHVDGLELLAISKQSGPERPVIVMTAYSAIDSAIDSIRHGAYHYLTKPFKVEELALFLARALDESRMRRETVALRKALRDRFAPSTMIGESAAMRRVFELIERVANTSVSVLITGETGTGKGLVAQAIHAQSARAAAPFVSLNCAALPENLLETELFGHVRGAFTGATARRAGLLREANGGTLFFDEIGEMSAGIQAKLLHVIECGTVRAVGADKEQPVDVRILAATHRDLREGARQGTFREDLLYRLDVVSVAIPPLRQRREDLPRLIEHFLAAARARHPSSPVRRLSPAASARLLKHSWPGNVRELEHAIERIVLLGNAAEVSEQELLPVFAPDSKESFLPEDEVLPMREIQKRYAQWAFQRLGARKMLAAEKLDIDFKTLSKLLQGESSEDAKD
ncbi:MAG TPA: sigma-54 dependent transcriptional regulator [Polyangiaceae bacterium]